MKKIIYLLFMMTTIASLQAQKNLPAAPSQSAPELFKSISEDLEHAKSKIIEANTIYNIVNDIAGKKLPGTIQADATQVENALETAKKSAENAISQIDGLKKKLIKY